MYIPIISDLFTKLNKKYIESKIRLKEKIKQINHKLTELNLDLEEYEELLGDKKEQLRLRKIYGNSEMTVPSNSYFCINCLHEFETRRKYETKKTILYCPKCRSKKVKSRDLIEFKRYNKKLRKYIKEDTIILAKLKTKKERLEKQLKILNKKLTYYKL